jgi:hypothetical protein
MLARPISTCMTLPRGSDSSRSSAAGSARTAAVPSRRSRARSGRRRRRAGGLGLGEVVPVGAVGQRVRVPLPPDGDDVLPGGARVSSLAEKHIASGTGRAAAGRPPSRRAPRRGRPGRCRAAAALRAPARVDAGIAGGASVSARTTRPKPLPSGGSASARRGGAASPARSRVADVAGRDDGVGGDPPSATVSTR